MSYQKDLFNTLFYEWLADHYPVYVAAMGLLNILSFIIFGVGVVISIIDWTVRWDIGFAAGVPFAITRIVHYYREPELKRRFLEKRK